MWSQFQNFWNNWLGIDNSIVTLPIPFTHTEMGLIDILCLFSIILIISFTTWFLWYMIKKIITF